MIFKAETAFTLVILLILVWASVTAWDWPFQARLFPLAISISSLALGLLGLGLDLFMAPKQPAAKEERQIIDMPSWEQSVPPHLARRRVGNIFGWMLGFYFSIWFVGFIISVPLFIWLYLIVQGRERWWTSLIYAALAQTFLLGLFHYILHIPWSDGFIAWPQEAMLELIGR